MIDIHGEFWSLLSDIGIVFVVVFLVFCAVVLSGSKRPGAMVFVLAGVVILSWITLVAVIWVILSGMNL